MNEITADEKDINNETFQLQVSEFFVFSKRLNKL